ncbi:hypothetical protein Dimus_019927 [Dionaea muscipula]
MAKRGRPRKRGGLLRADLTPKAMVVDTEVETVGDREVSEGLPGGDGSDSKGKGSLGAKQKLDGSVELWGDELEEILEDSAEVVESFTFVGASGSRFSVFEEVSCDQAQVVGEIAAEVDAQLERILSSPLGEL